MTKFKTTDLLDMAQLYADRVGGCKKVNVGSLLLSPDGSTILGLGANRAMPDLCRCRECMRVEKYGENSKIHRLPEDCRSIHSEVDAISGAAKHGIPLQGATAYVTRYPCEPCAKALISAGISRVVYGGTARISEQTRDLFERYGVDVYYVEGWKEDLSDK